jgi:hypothetical protein
MILLTILLWVGVIAAHEFDSTQSFPFKAGSCEWKKLPNTDISLDLPEIDCKRIHTFGPEDYVTVTDIDDPKSSMASIHLKLELKEHDKVCLQSLNEITNHTGWVETDVFSINFANYKNNRAWFQYSLREFDDQGPVSSEYEPLNILIEKAAHFPQTSGKLVVHSFSIDNNGVATVELTINTKVVDYHYGIIENFYCDYLPMKSNMQSLSCKVLQSRLSSEQSSSFIKVLPVDTCVPITSEETHITVESTFALSMDDVVNKQTIRVCTEYGQCKKYTIAKDTSKLLWFGFVACFVSLVSSVAMAVYCIHDYLQRPKRKWKVESENDCERATESDRMTEVDSGNVSLIGVTKRGKGDRFLDETFSERMDRLSNRSMSVESTSAPPSSFSDDSSETSHEIVDDNETAVLVSESNSAKGKGIYHTFE